AGDVPPGRTAVGAHLPLNRGGRRAAGGGGEAGGLPRGDGQAHRLGGNDGSNGATGESEHVIRVGSRNNGAEDWRPGGLLGGGPGVVQQLAGEDPDVHGSGTARDNNLDMLIVHDRDRAGSDDTRVQGGHLAVGGVRRVVAGGHEEDRQVAGGA